MKQISWIGLALILLGIALLAVPTLGRFFTLENIPSWLIYVYSSNGIVFITSPALILGSVLILVLRYLFN